MFVAPAFVCSFMQHLLNDHRQCFNARVEGAWLDNVRKEQPVISQVLQPIDEHFPQRLGLRQLYDKLLVITNFAENDLSQLFEKDVEGWSLELWEFGTSLRGVDVACSAVG